MTATPNTDLDLDDLRAIEVVLNGVAHVLDSHEYERLGEVFSEDVSFDNPGRLTAQGLPAVISAFRAVASPALSHHTTNVVVTPTGPDRADCVSKALALRPGGALTAAVYHDEVTRTAVGWRIASRRITPLG